MPIHRHVIALLGCLLAGWLLLPTGGWAASAPLGTDVVNTAVVSYADANGNPRTEASATVATTVSGRAEVTVTQTASSSPAAPGEPLVFTLRIESTGNLTAGAVSLIDTLPAGATFVAASGGGVFTPGAPGTVSWSLGDLAPGTVVNLTVELRVDAGTPLGSTLVNTTDLTWTGGSTRSSLAVPVGTAPNPYVTLSSPTGTVNPGGTLHFDIDFGNLGNLDATLARLVVGLADGVALVPGSVTGGGTLSGRQLGWTLGTLAPGSSGQVGFDVTVSPLAAVDSVIDHVATLLTSGTPAVTSATVRHFVVAAPPPPVLDFTKLDTPDPARVGNPIYYTLEVRNDGPSDLTDVVVTDRVPDGTTFRSADAGGTLASGVVSWTIATLAPGASQQLNLVVTVDSDVTEGTVISNSALAVAREVPFPSPVTTTTVASRTQGTVRFTDAAGNPATQYGLGATLYIEVSDADRNTDPGAIETVEVVLTNPVTGDREVLLLTETGPDTGVFRGAMPTSGAVATAGDGSLSVTRDSSVTATYTDPLDAVPVSESSALIDPLGVVFDTVTGAPIAGAVVALRWLDGATDRPASEAPGWPAGQAEVITTLANGAYQFPLVPPGDYYLAVTVPAPYTYPSNVAPGDLPPGFTINASSYGAPFTLAPGDPPLTVDLPADPPPGILGITLSADDTTVEIGDYVHMTLTVSNLGDNPITNHVIDLLLPAGVVYQPGSSTLGGVPIADPLLIGRVARWSGPDLAGGDSVELRFTARVTQSASAGQQTTTATATGISVGDALSASAQLRLEISKGVFGDRSMLFGKVFVDRDGDGMQNAGGDSGVDAIEPGVPNAVLYLEDGTRVVTDHLGRFSVRNVRPGTHVLRLDETTLPPGLTPSAEGNRALGRGHSLVLDVQLGLPVKANIPVTAERERLAALLRSWYVVDVGRDEPLDRAHATLQALPGQAGWVQGSGDRFRVLVEAGAGDDDPFTLAERLRSAGHAAARVVPRPEEGTPRAAAPTSTPTVSADPAATPDSLAPRLPPGADRGRVHIVAPVDGEVAGGDSIDVEILTPLEGDVRLLVDGRPVDKARLGRVTRDPNNALALHRFENVALARGTTATLTAQLADDPRAESSVRIHVPGRPAQIVITPPTEPLVADGRQKVEVAITVLDAQGLVLHTPSRLTVVVDGAQPVDADADGHTDGYQVAYRDGQATLRLQAPLLASDVEIEAIYDKVSATRTLSFGPHLRDPLLVGLGEVGAGAAAGGRGAFFYQGRVGEKTLLTARYDSERRDDDLFRSGDRDVDEEQVYPLTGDTSEVEYGLESTSKLYLRLDHERNTVLYGDFDTDLDSNGLAAYRQALTGLRADIRQAQAELRLFVAETAQTSFVDTFPGRGIAGLYRLDHAPLVPGSETVQIEVQDRFRPGRVLERRTLSRFIDYEIDYDDGTLLFRDPVASVDAAFNPQFVRVVYATESDGAAEHTTYGGQAGVQVTDALRLGATAVVDGQDGPDYRLAGLDATLEITPQHRLRAEWARSEGTLLGIDNLDAEGQAWRVELTGEPETGTRYSVRYSDTEEGFDNPASAETLPGTREFSVEASRQFAEDREIRASYYRARDVANDADSEAASLSYSDRLGARSKVTVGLSHEEIDAAFLTPDGDGDNRDLFTPAAEMPEEVTAATVGIVTKLTPKLDLRAQHKHGIAGDDYRLTQLGADYHLTRTLRLYLTQEFLDTDELEEQRTILGTESTLSPNTTLFNEYRVSDGQDGSANQQVIGLRNRFTLGDRFTANLTLENARTVHGSERTGSPDAYAVSASAEYLASQDTKLTSRVERREETGAGQAESWLVEVGGVHRIDEGLSVLARERLLIEEDGNGDERRTSRLLIGLAHRPLFTDRLNLFARFEWLHRKEDRQRLDKDALIFSAEGVYQAAPRLELTGKYAGKRVDDGPYDNYTDLVGAGLRYQFAPRFDIALGYRMVTDHESNDRTHSGTIELGYRLFDRVWLSVGYTDRAIDPDLGGPLSGEGAFVRLRAKFDEADLKSAFATGTRPTD